MNKSQGSSEGGTAESEDILFDRCVQELELNGYALFPLSTLLQRKQTTISIARSFETARRALDVVSDNKDALVASPIIDPSSDSGSWTGYHDAAEVNGRYNEYREGFVFSNGDMFDVTSDEGKGDCIDFRYEMNNLFSVMHDDVANGVLRAIERRLELPLLYFHRAFGPTHDSSQWHMKRYVVDARVDTTFNDEEGQCASTIGDTMVTSEPQKEAEIFLPVHTDPSLISVVILDEAGINKGGMGLEVFHPLKTENNSGTWKEISHMGHDVAVIFVGSVLSYLTKGQIFSAAKHRVVNWISSRMDPDGIIPNERRGSRVAATLFVRPNGDALMKSLPSPHLQIEAALEKNPPTFRVWNARVAKNYMKKKKKKRNNKNKD